MGGAQQTFEPRLIETLTGTEIQVLFVSVSRNHSTKTSTGLSSTTVTGPNATEEYSDQMFVNE